jgi:lipopolysaccharide transport system permease protein
MEVTEVPTYLHKEIEQPEKWSEIISSKANWFNINLKEVWRYRDLLFLFVKRDFVAQYKQTILGPLWNIIQPVFTTIMFLIVFNKIARISTDNLPPLLFYMSSITIWNYFSGCLGSSSSTFVSNAGIFGKVYFPRLVMPLSKVLSNMVKFGIQFCLLLAVLLYYVFTDQFTIKFGWQNLLFPLIVINMACMGLGVGIIISSLTTKYRDLNILIGFGVQLLMYITPVAYPLSYLEKSNYKTFIEWNPLSPMVEGFSYSLFGQGSFSSYSFLYSIFFTLMSLIIGTILFSKVERTFMDTG